MSGTPPETLDFPCPACGQQLRTARENAGQLRTCRHCGQRVQVPGRPALDPSPDDEAFQEMMLRKAQTGPARPRSGMTTAGIVLWALSIPCLIAVAADPAFLIVWSTLTITGAILYAAGRIVCRWHEE